MDVTRLVLEVENLVLTGFRPEDRDALVAALRGELLRQFALPDMASAAGSRSDTAHVRVGNLNVPRSLQPDQVGEWIARAIARGLTS